MKKTKIQMSPKCDYCGQRNYRFVVTANNMTFCLEQVLGNPPTKDCHQAYLDNLEKNKALKTAKVLPELSHQERSNNVSKLEAYRKELKQKRFALRQQSYR
jgi:hypothetical protein